MADIKEEKKVEQVETIAKEEYDKLYSEYQTLVAAFNKLLKEYNDLHLQLLFKE